MTTTFEFSTAQKEIDGVIKYLKEHENELGKTIIFYNSKDYRNFMYFCCRKYKLNIDFFCKVPDIDFKEFGWVILLKSGITQENLMRISNIDRIKMLSYRPEYKNGEIEELKEKVSKILENCHFENEKTFKEIVNHFQQSAYPFSINIPEFSGKMNYNEFVDYYHNQLINKTETNKMNGYSIIATDYQNAGFLNSPFDTIVLMNACMDDYGKELTKKFDYAKWTTVPNKIISYFSSDNTSPLLENEVILKAFSSEEVIKEEFLDKPSFIDSKIKEYDLSKLDVSKTIGSSIASTKVIRFPNCPFAFWTSVLERVKVPTTNNPTSIGSACHFLINMALTDVLNGKLSTYIKKEYLQEEVEKYAETPEFKNYILDRLTVENVISKSVETIYGTFQQLNNSDFKLLGTEVRIGEASQLKVNIEGLGDISLTGVIDRVDTYEKDGVKFLNVVDYKSGNDSFSVNKTQLAIYALSLKNTFPTAEIGGMYVQKIAENMVDLDKEATNKFKLKGPTLAPVVNNMDNSLGKSEDKTASEYIQVKLNKNGSLSKASEVVSQEEMGELLDVELETVKETLSRIANKEATIMSRGEYCRTCSYNYICGNQ